MALEGFWPAGGEVRVSGCFVATATCGDKDLVEALVERGSLPKRCCAYVGPKVRIRLPPAERWYGAGGEEWHHRRCNQLMECPDAPAERLEQVPRRLGPR